VYVTDIVYVLYSECKTLLWMWYVDLFNKLSTNCISLVMYQLRNIHYIQWKYWLHVYYKEIVTMFGPLSQNLPHQPESVKHSLHYLRMVT